MLFNLIKKQPGTALMVIDNVVDNLPFIVRRDHRMVAAFAKKSAAVEWAEIRSYNDESKFTVHTAAEVIIAYQDGNRCFQQDCHRITILIVSIDLTLTLLCGGSGPCGEVGIANPQSGWWRRSMPTPLTCWRQGSTRRLPVSG
jgi:hypothetical protein